MYNSLYVLILQVICDSCDEIYFNRIFDPDATVEHPLEHVKYRGRYQKQ